MRFTIMRAQRATTNMTSKTRLSQKHILKKTAIASIAERI